MLSFIGSLKIKTLTKLPITIPYNAKKMLNTIVTNIVLTFPSHF